MTTRPPVVSASVNRETAGRARGRPDLPAPAGAGTPAVATTITSAVVVAILTGAVVALQGKFNGDLSHAGAGIVLTGWFSYVGTVASVALVIVAMGRGPATAALLRRQGRWWWYVIGLCGIPIVLAMTGGIPVVGVAIASVCSVAGQTVTGLGFDARGIGLPTRLALTPRRALAGAVALAGLVVAIGAGAGIDASAWTVAVVCAALFAGGAILCVQQAGNGRVAGISGDPLVPGLTSAAGGTVGITLVLAAVAALGGLADIGLPGADRWYLYLGGPLGAVITVASAWAVRRLGTFALTLALVGGQMATAILLDAVGSVGLAWQTFAATAAVCGAVVLAIPRRGRGLPR